MSSKSEEVGMDNPAYAQLDPHLKFDESEDMDLDSMALQPGARPQGRRPPSFDTLMNNIKAITKKQEHIKGFKFELSQVVSQNLMIQNQWVIPP